jgi:hypothetical protein
MLEEYLGDRPNMEVRGGGHGAPDEPLVAVFAPGAQRTRSLSLDTVATEPTDGQRLVGL